MSTPDFVLAVLYCKMEFILPFKIKEPAALINLNQPIILSGSCFTQHICQKLTQHFVPAIGQPQGVIYNPLQLFNGISRASQKEFYQASELYTHNGMWHSWQHHSSFNHENKDLALHKMNETLLQTHELLNKEKPVLFLTLGSAWVYKMNEQSVANCHKYPQSVFNKELLSVQDIVFAFERMLALLPSTQIVLTVSPVKHVKDGLLENNISKGILLTACFELMQKYPQTVYYFPAYELVTDVLRDYRFYASDLIHPNQVAIDYVWEQFAKICLSAASHEYLKLAHQVFMQTQHVIMQPLSAETALFEQKKQKHIAEFMKLFPWAVQPK